MKLFGGSILFILALLVCLPGFDTGFVADDFIYLGRVHDDSSVKLAVTPVDSETPGFRFYRPVTMVAWKLDYLLHGMNPTGYHVTNTGLFILAVLLTTQLVYRIHRNGWTAFIAGLVLCLHPSIAGNSAWLAYRADLLASVFSLTAILLFLAMPSNQSRGCFNSIGALICSILAMASKESALITPLLIVVCDRMDSRKDTFTPTRSPFYGAHFIALAVILLVRFLALGTLIGSTGASVPVSLISIIDNLRDYLNQILFPLCIDFRGKPVLKLIVFIGITALFSTAFLFRRLRFSISFAAIALIPVLHLDRSQYLLIPMTGFACLIANFLQSEHHRDRSMEANLVSGVIVVTLLGAYGMEALQRTGQWRDAGLSMTELRSALQAAVPDPELSTHFELDGWQASTHIFPGLVENSLTRAVRLWYENQTLSARISPETAVGSEEQDGPVQTLIFNNSHLIQPLFSGQYGLDTDLQESRRLPDRTVVIRIE